MLQCELNDKKKTKPLIFSCLYVDVYITNTSDYFVMSLLFYVDQTKHKCWKEEMLYQINPSFLKSNSWVKLEGCSMMK